MLCPTHLAPCNRVAQNLSCVLLVECIVCTHHTRERERDEREKATRQVSVMSCIIACLDVSLTVRIVWQFVDRLVGVVLAPRYNVEQQVYLDVPLHSRFSLCLYDFGPSFGWHQKAHLEDSELKVSPLATCSVTLSVVLLLTSAVVVVHEPNTVWFLTFEWRHLQTMLRSTHAFGLCTPTDGTLP